MYSCSCGWKAQADMNGALNIFERAFQGISHAGE
jgi:transposase